jgi:hypothetical protein
MTPEVAHRMLIGLAERVRETPCPVGMLIIVFHHASCLAEALAASDSPHAAAAAATLQLGPARGGTEAWHLATADMRGPGSMVGVGLVEPHLAEWALHPDVDEVRFLLMNAHDAICALGVNRYGPPILFTPTFR